MAHYCPECSMICHCNGDIEDLLFDDIDRACDHCYCPDCDQTRCLCEDDEIEMCFTDEEPKK